MGAGRSGLWAPVLVGHVVYLVHFVLVILGQKKSDKKSDSKIGQKSEKKSQNKSHKIWIQKRDIQSSKASNFKPDKKSDKQKKFGPRVGRKIQQ